MQLDRNAKRLGMVEDTTHLVDSKGNSLTKAVDGVDQFLAVPPVHTRKHDVCDVVAVPTLVFQRGGMSAEISRDDPDGSNLLERSRRSHHVEFAVYA